MEAKTRSRFAPRFGGVLFLLAVLQVFVYLNSGRVKYVDFEVGEVLPYAVAGWTPFGDQNDCQVAFIVSVNCPACNRLADRYAGIPEVATATQLEPWWFLDQDSATAADWAREHSLPRERVLRIGVKKRFPGLRPIIGRTWFTPTRAVFRGKSLELRDIRPSDQLLTGRELETICSQGGVAINNFAEGDRLLGGGDE
jgi:hypothetical protein